MKLTILAASLLLALANSATCVPGPVVPVPDAGPACTLAPSACACENLADKACEEGSDPYCVQNIEHAMGDRITFIDVECLASAHSKTAIRACAGMQNGCP